MKKILVLGPLALATLSTVGWSATPPAHAWEIGPWVKGRNYSVGMPSNPASTPDGGVAFEFPQDGRGEIDAMTVATAPFAGAREIIVRYRIDAAPGARFLPAETPAETATVSLYFQRAGDNWSGKGPYQSYRWYVPLRAVQTLTPGVHTMRVSFDEVWTNVNGQPNSNAEQRAQFATALANTDRVGLAFGSPTRRSHGVYATGPARFTLLSFDVR